MKLQYCSKQPEQTKRGFTRADLCAVLMAVTVLAFIALPALGKMKPHSDRASCINNLRQLGVGWISWAKENGNKPPWYVNPTNGGTKSISLAYVHFSVLSNYVANPAIMICPIDPTRIRARDFSDSPSTGLLATNMQRRAVGYGIGTELSMDEPKAILAGDRFVRPSATGHCGAADVSTAKLRRNSSWTSESHEGRAGNLLFCDGSVRTLNSDGIGRSVENNTADAARNGCFFY